MYGSDVPVSQSCAVALAVQDIFPRASVGTTHINPFPWDIMARPIYLPPEAIAFINQFDDLAGKPEERMALPELSFEVEIPEEILATIDISEISVLLENHPTLKIREVENAF